MPRKEKKKCIAVSLYRSLWKRVQGEAKRRELSASALASIMIQAGLKRLEDEKADLLTRLS